MPETLSFDSTRLHYEVHDYTDPWREAPVLVLQHGIGRSGRFWFNVIPYLSRFYRVVCPDLRGLGGSKFIGGLKEISAEAYVRDVVAVIDDLGVERVHFAGESLGGLVGILLASQRPDRVKTLSVFSPPLFFDAPARRALSHGFPSWHEAILALGSQGWAAAVSTNTRFAPDTDPKLLEWHASEMGKSDTAALAETARAIVDWNLTPHLSAIKAPVLAFYPASGSVASSEQQETLRANIKNVQIVRVPAKSQLVQTLQPATCASLLLHFISLHDGIACHEA